MRILILLALAALVAVPAAAQSALDATRSIHPLPPALAPDRAPSTEAGMAADPMARGLLTGMLVGAATGVGFAVTVADRCGVGPESDCTLAPEYKTFVYGVIGGSLGALIGVGTTFLLGEDATPPADASALTLMPDGGGMRAGVRLRL